MRLMGVTQGSSLKVFLRLTDALKEKRGIEQVSVFVADSMVFKSLARAEPQLTDGTLALLKEWEVLAKGRDIVPDWDRLREYERFLGDPVLWNALMADRRVFFGRRCKLRQDYRPRFSSLEMAGILQAALERIEAFLVSNSPDLIVGFGTSTIGDYLFYRFAKSRGIPYLQLKATKVGNRVALNDDAVSLSDHVRCYLDGREEIPTWALDEAREYLEQTRQKGVQYEGAIQRGRKFSLGQSLMIIARGLAVDIKRWLDPQTRRDNQSESMFLTHFHERFRNPLAAAVIERRLRTNMVSAEELQGYSPFTFFPLHFEPEVSLQVFGRPYQNQIELIRVLAFNLPAGMDLLVKEHPRARGFRPWSYYRKLLEIPNVRMVETMLPTHQVVRLAALVANISGSTGLEAAILGRPVITFGTPVYNILSGNMIRHVTDLNRLGWEIRDLLGNYCFEKSALERYIGATIAGSVPVDLYTALLGKQGRMRDDGEGKSDNQRREEGYQLLTEYCLMRIENVTKGTSATVRSV